MPGHLFTPNLTSNKNLFRRILAEHLSRLIGILGLTTNSKEFFIPRVTRIMEKAHVVGFWIVRMV